MLVYSTVIKNECLLFFFRKVRIAPSAMGTPIDTPRPALRRPTGFVRPKISVDSDTEVKRQSVLARLYDELAVDSELGPTLKDYK